MSANQVAVLLLGGNAIMLSGLTYRMGYLKGRLYEARKNVLEWADFRARHEKVLSSINAEVEAIARRRDNR